MLSILIADDDPDDRMLIQEAFEEIVIKCEIDFVNDGVELLEHLKNKSSEPDQMVPKLPGIILLDLNMPRKDGRTVLREIKQDDGLSRIPVVVLTTSTAEEDITKTYGLGVSSYITKPVTFEGLCEVVQSLSDYWCNTVSLPPECRTEGLANNLKIKTKEAGT